ncbi:hypothetical protein HUU42_11110 [bacterium]|nr:hypothetical protein [bacterium]
MAKKTKRKAVKKAKPVKKAIKKAAKKIVAKKPKPVKKAKKAAVSRASKLSPEQLMMKVQNKVEGFLKKMYKSTFEKHEDGRFLVFEGTTAIQTVIRPWHENDVVVESFSYVVQNANIDDNLMKFLLRENAVIHFGAFGLTFDGTIIFSHSLAGANLDENEFTASIKSVARIADYYDERIVQMAGGMTAREAMKQGIM